MDANPITTALLIRILLIVLAAEVSAMAGVRWIPLPPLAILGLVRCLQITGMLWAIHRWSRSWSAIGWPPGAWRKGLYQGALWSLGFGAVASAGMGLIYLAGHNPLQWLRSPLPAKPLELSIFFLVGGIVAPIAEEICFRGAIYSYMRDSAMAMGNILWPHPSGPRCRPGWMRVVAVFFAILASTTIFALLHAIQGIPIIQIVGGVVLALAYETSRNLMVPMVIHAIANLALFSLSLLAVSLG